MSKDYWKIYDTVAEYIRFADVKAGAIIAFAGASVAFLADRFLDVRDILFNKQLDCFTVWLYLAFLIYLVSTVLVFVYGFKVIWPRTKPSQKDSRVFFGHTAATFSTDQKSYAKTLSSMSDERLNEDIAEQIVELSKIATAKFLYVGRAVRMLVALAISWLSVIGILFFLAK